MITKTPQRPTTRQRSKSANSAVASTTDAKPKIARAKPEAKPLPDALGEHRLRQEKIAGILEKVFGPFADSNPDLWEHRAYLMLIGTVHNYLAFGGDGISAKELTDLAKVLSDNRGTSKTGGARKDPRTGGSSAPEEDDPRPLSELVQEVYGTKIEEPAVVAGQ